MKTETLDKLVLGTVNAPWKRTMSAETLVNRLANDGAERDLPHLATFFMEVRPHLVIAFAEAHAISMQTLRSSYLSVKHKTGEESPSLESALGGLGTPA